MTKNTQWTLGVLLVGIGFASFYFSSAFYQSDLLASHLLLAVSVASVLGLFILIGRAVDAAVPTAIVATHKRRNASRGQWVGWQKTVGILAIGLVALLGYVGLYVGAWANMVQWLIYPALGLTALAMLLVVAVTTGRTE